MVSRAAPSFLLPLAFDPMIFAESAVGQRRTSNFSARALCGLGHLLLASIHSQPCSDQRLAGVMGSDVERYKAACDQHNERVYMLRDCIERGSEIFYVFEHISFEGLRRVTRMSHRPPPWGR